MQDTYTNQHESVKVEIIHKDGSVQSLTIDDPSEKDFKDLYDQLQMLKGPEIQNAK